MIKNINIALYKSLFWLDHLQNYDKNFKIFSLKYEVNILPMKSMFSTDKSSIV